MNAESYRRPFGSDTFAASGGLRLLRATEILQPIPTGRQRAAVFKAFKAEGYDEHP